MASSSGGTSHATPLQTPTQKDYVIYRTDDAVRRAIEELRVRLKWWESRRSPARCLACGSTEIEPVRFGKNRSCVVRGKRLIEVEQGFADTADWIAVFSSEGAAVPSNGRQPYRSPCRA